MGLNGGRLHFEGGAADLAATHVKNLLRAVNIAQCIVREEIDLPRSGDNHVWQHEFDAS